MSFVMQRPAPEDGHWQAPGTIVVGSKYTRIPVSPNEIANASMSQSGERDTVAHGRDERIRVARAVPIFVYTGGSAPRATLEGDIHLIRRSIESTPPKLFNAKALKAALEPIVTAEKCGAGNICSHVHEYFLPKGKLPER